MVNASEALRERLHGVSVMVSVGMPRMCTSLTWVIWSGRDGGSPPVRREDIPAPTLASFFVVLDTRSRRRPADRDGVVPTNLVYTEIRTLYAILYTGEAVR
jgi:hypothetical protein